MRHGSVKRQKLYVATMDIKTAFDVSRPTYHLAENDYRLDAV